MRTNTTKDQLDGLVLILTEMLNMNRPNDIAQDLVYDHVVTAYNKMRIRSEAVTPKAGYTVSLTHQEARAIFLFVNYVYIPVERYKYEATVIQSLSDQIHAEYGQHPFKRRVEKLNDILQISN